MHLILGSVLLRQLVLSLSRANGAMRWPKKPTVCERCPVEEALAIEVWVGNCSCIHASLLSLLYGLKRLIICEARTIYPFFWPSKRWSRSTLYARLYFQPKRYSVQLPLLLWLLCTLPKGGLGCKWAKSCGWRTVKGRAHPGLPGCLLPSLFTAMPFRGCYSTVGCRVLSLPCPWQHYLESSVVCFWAPLWCIWSDA